MFNRGGREKERMAAETAPYRQMAVDLEVETKLQTQDFDLAVANRHLLTSNDRQQLSAAHLHTARHYYLVASAIAEAVGADSSKDTPRAIETTTGFVTSVYQSAKNCLETAEHITAQPGLQTEPTDIHNLSQVQKTVGWPSPDTISRSFVSGLITGLDRTWAYAYHHYETTVSSRSVPNDFKRRLQHLADPLLKTIDNKRMAIERVTLGGLTATTPEAVIREVYEDCQTIHITLEELTTLLTMPRIRDAAFTLREQYDETAPEKKSFDPSTLGTPAIQQTVAQPQRPKKPFSPDTLGSPALQTPPPVGKPFSTDSLTSPAQTAPTASRPFTPNILGTPEPAKRKPGEFDPSVLDPKKDDK